VACPGMMTVASDLRPVPTSLVDEPDQTEYRINYTITRRQPGAEDVTEIGFGSSTGDRDIDGALYEVQSDVQNFQWETEPGQPDPEQIRADIKAARHV
jgi:hypothetical protein